MGNLVMLAMCLLAGLALRLTGRTSEGTPAAINTVVVYVCLPALTLHHLHGFDLAAARLLPVLMPWALFLLGALLFWIIGKSLQLSSAAVGALTLVAGLGNTSFVGLPMIEALRGRDGLALGMLIDQLGSYLVLSTAGVVAVSAYAAAGPISMSAIARKVITFPPFLALALSVLLLPLTFPAALDTALTRIGDTLAPLALLSVGMQLRFDGLLANRRLIGIGLGYKLLLCPAVVLAVLKVHGGGLDLVSHVSLIEASMPPMIGAGIVATQAGLAPRLVAALIGIGIPVGMSTAVLWDQIFRWTLV